MTIDLSSLSELLAKHHVFAVLVGGGLLWKIFRPSMVDLRAGIVEGVAIMRAVAKKFGGLTDDEIAAERPAVQKIIPEVPEDPGVLAKILGAAKTLGSSSERRV
jgi:hypothetical protein